MRFDDDPYMLLNPEKAELEKIKTDNQNLLVQLNNLTNQFKDLNEKYNAKINEINTLTKRIESFKLEKKPYRSETKSFLALRVSNDTLKQLKHLSADLNTNVSKLVTTFILDGLNCYQNNINEEETDEEYDE
jgi:DNA repair ATPase RecN